jgi:hypothetical protein
MPIIRPYGLVSGTILLNKRFATAASAKRWGQWNARGSGVYEVIKVDEYEKVLEKAKIAKKPKRRGQCNCDKPDDLSRKKTWRCPVHGNIWNGVGG